MSKNDKEILHGLFWPMFAAALFLTEGNPFTALFWTVVALGMGAGFLLLFVLPTIVTEHISSYMDSE